MKNKLKKNGAGRLFVIALFLLNMKRLSEMSNYYMI
jgi:hypothetical protein